MKSFFAITCLILLAGLSNASDQLLINRFLLPEEPGITYRSGANYISIYSNDEHIAEIRQFDVDSYWRNVGKAPPNYISKIASRMAELLCAADSDEGMNYCEVENVKFTKIHESVMHLTLEMSHISVTYSTKEKVRSPLIAFANYFKYPDHEEVFVYIPAVEKEITLKHLPFIKEISKVIPK